MPSNTTRFNLYKVNPTTDGEMTFNIDTVLNQNWDNIESQAAKLTDIPTIPSSLPANGGNSTTVNNHTAAAAPNTTEQTDLIGMVNEVNNNLTSHEAESANKTISNMTYYVDATNGNDSNTGLTSGTAFKTITKAISLLPPIINHTVNINVLAGTYNEIVLISGFVGTGAIYLNGGTDLTTSLNYKVNAIYFKKCVCPIIVTGFQSIAIDGVNAGFWCTTCLNVFFSYCSDIVNASSKTGFNADYSYVSINNCQISNKAVSIIAYTNGSIYSNTNSGTGNTLGLQAIGGTLMKNGTQPSGATNEAQSNGGVIR